MTKENSLKRILKYIQEGANQDAIKALQLTSSPQASLITQNQYTKLGHKILFQLSDLPVIKIALLASVTLEHWVESLKFWLLLEGYKLEPHIVPIGTWQQQVLDTNSNLYHFKPDIVWFFLHQSDLNIDEGKLHNENTANDILDQLIQNIDNQVSKVINNTAAICIINNIVASTERVFGNYEGSIDTSPAALIQRYNLEFLKQLPKGAVVFDIAHIASSVGLNQWYDVRLWHHSKHPFSFNVQAEVAFSAARLLAATKGHAKKCLILDLDNTLWGGIIGDDGIEGIQIGSNSGAIGEAYSHFQQWVKSLANRGIALAVCSKNDKKLAQKAFNKKNGMILQLSDFAAFRANWENKVDNIRAIAQEINLGLNALVFVDDNPAERELIRQQLPEIAVPELPVDPSGYIQAITAGKWFETLGITKEDNLRVQAYQENQARKKAQNTSTDLSAYLQSLQMNIICNTVDSSSLLRATQLINKTNQFNMTTARYTEKQVNEYMSSQNHYVGSFSLKDRFGDFGIIAITILEYRADEAIIDTWVMSCRVFSRGVEDFIFKKLCTLAKQQNCKKIIGKYKPSQKNKVIADLYHRLGGTNKNPSKIESRWYFDLAEEPIHHNETFINETQEQK